MNLIGVVSTKCLKKEWVIAIQQCYSYYTFESMAKKLKEDPSWKKVKATGTLILCQYMIALKFTC